MNTPADSHPVSISGALSVPGIASTSLILGGISLPDWVCIMTLVSIFVGLAYTIWKFWRDLKRAAEEDDENDDVPTLAERKRFRYPEDE